jgi:hypothetical protein
MKKFLNFVGLSVDADGKFLHQMRRAQTKKELFGVCDDYLMNQGQSVKYFNSEPFEGLVARPSSESGYSECKLS